MNTIRMACAAVMIDGSFADGLTTQLGVARMCFGLYVMADAVSKIR